LTVLVGTQLLSVAIEKYAIINVVGVGIWIVICILIMKEYKKLKAKPQENQTGF
jgi:hypothetical protein